jgi:molybdate transport system substrate-binding protein
MGSAGIQIATLTMLSTLIMIKINALRRSTLGLTAAMLLCPVFVAAQTQEIKVMISGGFAAPYKELVPRFERETDSKVISVHGPSMGLTIQAIPSRLARGEEADMVIMADEALEKLIETGTVTKGTKTPLANSLIGMAIKSGTPAPDIGTVQSFRKALLDAKSIAYSDSASGVYIKNSLFPNLGITDEMAEKSRAIPAEPVAAVVARGEAELGLQQVSELLPVPGITLVGKIPAEVQKVTVFSAGITANAKNGQGADALIRFLTSETVAGTLVKSGLDPVKEVKR